MQLFCVYLLYHITVFDFDLFDNSLNISLFVLKKRFTLNITIKYNIASKIDYI